MKNKNTQLLQELEQLSSQELSQMLHTQLEKDKPDGELVRQLLILLKAREPAYSEQLTPEQEAAWQQFKKDCAEDREYLQARKKPRWFAGMAAMAVIAVLLLFTIPAAESAQTVLERLGSWKDSVLAFFAPTEEQPQYVFQTDHPGLQQIYDELTSLGVTRPVVPTWIPEGYELSEFNTTNTPAKIRIYAVLTNGERAITFRINIYGADAPRQYEITNSDTKEVDMAGIIHSISNNNDAWMAIWSSDNLECSLTVDCQEDILYRILESIYVTEAN